MRCNGGQGREYDSGDIGSYQIDSELVLGPSQGRPSTERQVAGRYAMKGRRPDRHRELSA